ncbi:MAG: hypothetical protein M3016_08510 [Actinomycetota bacterium]|nr:hypothetical protein [Actinomycetota bacterium]
MSETGPQPPVDTCMPCRGTGKLTSGLGGEAHEVRCPWCEGTGHRVPGINAQESPAESAPSPPSLPSPSPPPSPSKE